MRAVVACLVGVVLLLVSVRVARADSPDEDIGGVVQPATPPGDTGRSVLEALLFVPRTFVRIAVFASTSTASFFENQQVVPRTRELLESEDGSVRIVPTLSLGSGLRPDIGARVSTRRKSFSSMMRADFIGANQYVLEGRLLQAFGKNDHTQIGIEGYQQRSLSGYGGVGPAPTRDDRNAFLPGKMGSAGGYRQQRERIIGTFGARVAVDYEILLSSSFQRRTISDNPDDTNTMNTIFVPGSVPGANARSERTYNEIAIRRDTRAVRGPPAAGLLLEVYGGASNDLNGTFAPALHSGGRVAWFISIVRTTSILSPRLQIDVVSPLGNKGFPFQEYAYASGFRGEDGRTDRVAALASLDYRWQLRTYIAARVFFDTTTVAPAIPRLDVKHLTWATGIGIDLHSRDTLLGRFGISFSTEAVQLFLVFGLADPGFGDRQHR